MQVVYHIGAHFIDEGRLVRCLLDNAAMLEQRGCVVPHPRRYRAQFRNTLNALRGGPADDATQEALLDGATDVDHFDRILFCHDNFIGFPVQMISDDGFYALAPARLRALVNLFPEAETEVHLAPANPATLLPPLLRFLKDRSYAEVMAGHSPLALRWAPVVRQIAAALEGRRLVVWCNEDTPLIWPDVLRSLADVPPEVEMAGDDAVLAAIMAPEGLVQLRAQLAGTPPADRAARQALVAAALDQFALPERLEIEIPLPGWTDDLVARISAAYDADVAAITAMPGVDFIAP